MITNNFFYTDQMDSPRQIAGMANLRMFHASPGAPEVDIYANGRQIARRLAYGQFTDYISLAMGTYTIEVFPAGLKDSPVLKVSLPIESKVYTFALIGILPRIGLLPIVDEFVAINPGTVNIRFANLSPNAPALDLVSREGLPLFTGINFTGVSDYRAIRPGRREFFVRQSGSTINVLYLPVQLLPKRNLTFYLVGIYDQQPSNLKVYIPLDGTTYLRDY